MDAHLTLINVLYTQDRIALKSEVYFPNLAFSQKKIDFGCILNDTEVQTRAVMSNNSPLPVHYAWYFIKRPPVVRSREKVDPEWLDEGVEMESEYESSEERSSEEEQEESGDGGERDNGSQPAFDEDKEESEGDQIEDQHVDVVIKEVRGGELVEVDKDLLEGPITHVKISEHATFIEEDSMDSSGCENISCSKTSIQDNKVIESGIPSVDSQPVLPATEELSLVIEEEAKEEEEEGRRKKKKKKPRKKLWNVINDPFIPIPISQVSSL